MSCRRAVVLLSGGMDSAVCASIAKSEGFTLYVLHVNYGQRTSKKERECAEKLATFFKAADFKVISLGFLKEIGGSGLLDESIALPVEETEGIPPSYVPFRNSIILSLATAWAEVVGAEALFYGANFIDFSGYPDCRPQYFEAFQRLIDTGTKDDTVIVLRTPLASLSKADIVRKGLELGTPFALTWSCYTGTDKACGVCDSCRLRLKGFHENGLTDPITYE
ncbi:MAG: 7-cyano-7-deazaguanine synthase QueC [Theionarchaea archaeon]|nr:7-cyano-7-deazaguanine synthase QueC [Theionarchaea archaeon]MBU6999609.1 7-cyano-7-deazaguanine synthase QueC [Theionarchaea archaeon]MBU7020387.1 7-cyano-7-deazaguanine synthase QueC [Theionarchaea archaeon]MBU7035478.1 7-cyano-7-deazaguanine synthase QueC [Theionarchaea archaeon]MBU7041127.1 7-cyano-7-deazaguanine synthase QueC [Theionarchaea archaeon]